MIDWEKHLLGGVSWEGLPAPGFTPPQPDCRGGPLLSVVGLERPDNRLGCPGIFIRGGAISTLVQLPC